MIPRREAGPWRLMSRVGRPRSPGGSDLIFQPGFPRWLHPVADDGSAKGVRTTIPVVNRRCRSGSALYRDELAMGNAAQWSFHALRAYPCLPSTHLSCWAVSMLLDQGPSWRQRGRPQPVDQAQDLGEQRPCCAALKGPLLAMSGPSELAVRMSALGRKADLRSQRPLFRRLHPLQP